MKIIISVLFALATLPAFANDTAAKIAFLLADPAVSEAIDAAVVEGQQNDQKSWFKGVVISEQPTTCKGDRETYVLLYGRTVAQNGQTQTQKCSQLVHFGDCNTVTGKIGDIEKTPRCKKAK